MRKRPLLALLALATIVAAGTLILRSGERTADATAIGTPPTGASGLIATTGDPDKADVPVPVQPEFSTSGEGLVVESSPVPGGGQMIDLQGRFQHAATATVTGPDSVVVECLPDSGKHGEGER